MKTVALLQGAFDIINWGHIKAFENIKKHADILIIALNSDELLQDYKNKKAVIPYYQKKFIIESCKFVDKVVKANEFSPLKLLKKHKVDIYVLTREWEHTKTEEIAYMQNKGGQILFSPRFKGVVCTSDIKKILLAEAKASRHRP